MALDSTGIEQSIAYVSRLATSTVLDDAMRAIPPGGVAALVSEHFIDTYRDRPGATELTDYRRMLVEARPTEFWGWLRTIPSTTGADSAIRSLAVSPDGRLVVTGHRDGTVLRWDPGTGAQVGEPFTGHGSQVRAIAITADNQQIISGDADGIIRRWSTTYGDAIDVHTSSRGRSVSALIAGDRLLVAGFDSGDLRAWRLGSGRRDQEGFSIQTGAVTGLVAMPGGHVIRSGDEDGVIHMWNAQTGDFIERRQISDSAITVLAVSPNGDHLVAGCADGRLRIWHLGTKEITTTDREVAKVRSVAVTSDNRHVIATYGHMTVRRWSLMTGEPAGEFAATGDNIDAVGVSPDGRFVLAGGRRGVLRRWDAITGAPITGVVPTERLADVVSDLESAEDALGIAGDVQTIAAVLASLTTTPPLSVALLGDWGAGKSSFMRQLQVRMTALAEHSAGAGRQAAFAANLRQVSFNAWHYSDDHLWVGLVEHLFRELQEPCLAGPDDTDELESKLEDDEKERTQLEHDLRAVEGIESRRGLLKPIFAALRSMLVFRAVLGSAVREVRSGGWRLWMAAALLLVGIGVIVVGAEFGQQVLAWLGAATALLGPVISLMRVTESARDRLRARKTELDDDIRMITRKLDDLDPARRLNRLLEEISDANRYADFRGLTGQIHHDLRRLSDDLAAARDRWDGIGTPPLQRIVLYVDDLDRCAPDRVVDVLQAVNLLLTMDLFMVVIAVDPSWLLRSLRNHHGELLADDAVAYLDKIFHIPFALRPMGDHAAGFLRSLLPPPHDPEPQPTGPTPAPAPAPRQPEEAAPAISDPVPAIPDASQPDNINAEGLRVTRDEREFLVRLTPLLSTPRAIKKLTNLYRLLRLSVPQAGLDAFLGGPYQAAALLLAAVAGTPQEARALLTGLSTDRPDQDIVDTRRAVGNPLAIRLADLIVAIRKEVPVHGDTKTYRRWACVVARYGFETYNLFTDVDQRHGKGCPVAADSPM
jgi:WD40 repeat protein